MIHRHRNGGSPRRRESRRRSRDKTSPSKTTHDDVKPEPKGNSITGSALVRDQFDHHFTMAKCAHNFIQSGLSFGAWIPTVKSLLSFRHSVHLNTISDPNFLSTENGKSPDKKSETEEKVKDVIDTTVESIPEDTKDEISINEDVEDKKPKSRSASPAK